MKIKKKYIFFLGGGWVEGGGQDGCELKSEAFVKIKKKIGGGGSGWGVQGGCESRSEAFVKIQKKIIFFFFFLGGGGGGGSGWGGVRVDGNGELKLCSHPP